MCAVTVAVALEIEELRLQITVSPEQRAVQALAPDVPISRSKNGCDSGTYGTVLISVTSRIRKLVAIAKTDTADHGPN